MLSKDLNNLNKKLYAFGNIVLKNEKKKWAPDQYFDISFWNLNNPGSEFVSLVNF